MFTIFGTGCALLDFIYSRVDFGSPAMAPYRSRSAGDGGLEPGKLVFADEFEKFSGKRCGDVLSAVTGGVRPDAENIGGPAIVALINAAQLLDPTRFEVRFAGAVGGDAAGKELRTRIGSMPLKASFVEKSGATPCTYVLSDPSFDGGRGERTFLNTIGAAGVLTGADLPPDFLDADLIVFGGTALVPRLHDELDVLLPKAKARGAFTVVNTVYDFRNERKNPRGRWPLGSSDAAYRHIDLLIADKEEAFRLSGTESVDAALAFFRDMGVGAAVVTNGARDIALFADSGAFKPCSRSLMPVSDAISAELAARPERKGDTTGCGDNFAGGMIAEIARQLEAGAGRVDLSAAVAWGAVSGGFACFQMGGVYREDRPGRKLELLAPYLAAYLEDMEDRS